MRKLDVVIRLLIAAMSSVAESAVFDEQHEVYDDSEHAIIGYTVTRDGIYENILYRMKVYIPENGDKFRAVAELITLNPNEGEEFATLSLAIKGEYFTEYGPDNRVMGPYLEMFKVSGNVATDIENRSDVYIALLKSLI